MATPTKEEVFPPKMDKHTPIPDGMAMAIPVNNPVGSPRMLICSVGHVSSAMGVKLEQIAIKAPITTQPKRATDSLNSEERTKGQSLI